MTRILVGIANHGTKNRKYLDQLFSAYRAMSHDVDFVIFSDAPKDLGPDVEVRVGAPSPNPWSLPFASRTLFAERADEYDLFIYTEDDTLIEQAHIDAFLAVDAVLPPDCIPGFMRYELDPAGNRSFCTVHTGYHWVPESVQRHGDLAFAEFTNPHSACHVLTRDHLRRALRSGGFLVPPHEGRFDMLATAASDPYTQCGLTRLLCVSRIDDFLLHHLPNVYLGRFGIDAKAFYAQAHAIERMAAAGTPGGSLFDGVTKLDADLWDKRYYGEPDPIVVEELGHPASVLSIGTTSGELENVLAAGGARVLAVPIDDIVGAAAATGDVEVLPADLNEALTKVDGQRFEAIALVDVLAHVPDPAGLLVRLAPLLAAGGRLVATSPNFRHHRLRHRINKGPDPAADGDFASRGLHLTTPETVAGWLAVAGLEVASERYSVGDGKVKQAQRLTRGRVDQWLGTTVITVAGANEKAQGRVGNHTHETWAPTESD
jgi:SAM-dependent methyltransferase